MQSHFFDGKQPNWYHFACFFKGSVIVDSSTVSGFGSLRWEDQERIRKKITGQADGDTDVTDGPAAEKSTKKSKVTRSDLTVEYAKSNRSNCKGCNTQIDKVSTDLRLSGYYRCKGTAHVCLGGWVHT